MTGDLTACKTDALDVTLMFGNDKALRRFSRPRQHFSCRAPIRVSGGTSLSFLCGPFLFHSLGKQDTSFLRFHSSEGAASTDLFSQPVPSPSYFPASHDLPCAAETRGKVAALRSVDTGSSRRRSTRKSSQVYNIVVTATQTQPFVLDAVQSAFVYSPVCRSGSETVSDVKLSQRATTSPSCTHRCESAL